MRTFTITTLGCKVNQYDGELIRESLLSAGWSEPVPPDAQPGLCIVNTCAVTWASEGKSRRAVLRALREHPQATLVVTGCCADLSASTFAKIPGVTHVLGNEMKGRIHQVVGGVSGDGASSIRRFSGHTRAFLKIQDGCNSACSYCVVPLARGRSRSRTQAQIVDEAAALVENGHVEIVLCGIHLGNYGKDRGEPQALVRLIEKLSAIDGLARIRLSSIEPEDVTDELIRLIASGGPLCPHLHIPLQSGDDRILKAMNRRYSNPDYRRLVDAIRAHVPEASITTDIMVGFPGEDDEAVRNTIDMARYAAFSRAHIFPYSPRPRTAAWRLGDPIGHETKVLRRALVSAAADETAAEYRKRFVGRDVEALVQGRCAGDGAGVYGLTREYLRVYIEGDVRGIEKGRLCRVRIERVLDDGIAGKRVQG
jgi:threonylcarbamoyladenosine tRNA methylthiotransferase MtaB